MKLKKITKELLKFIPGGSHTYSRGYDQFPSNAPQILKSGKGCYIFDNKDNKLIDFGMGLRSVNIGYSEKVINEGAIEEINNGNNLTRPSLIELNSAKTLVSLIKSIDMVKFTKNGSTAVTAAVKLARAYTRKKYVLRCSQHPFFSYDDWFIGSTVINRGIPSEIKKLTKKFNYNDIDSLKKAVKIYKNNIACVVLEPSQNECPKSKIFKDACCNKFPCIRNFKRENHFLKEVETICKENGIVFILDEMITGFRWSLGGAQQFYNVDPDISTFGKAMANGFSLSAVCGKKKIMELGSIVKKNEERVFLLSTTHGAEMSSLGAFIQCISFLKEKNVIQKNWDTGNELFKTVNQISKSLNIEKNFKLKGIVCSPYYETRNLSGELDPSLRTLFMQEMIKNGVLMPWISICYRHDKTILKKTINAVEKSLHVFKKALNGNVKNFLKGHIIKPVFRKFN